MNNILNTLDLSSQLLMKFVENDNEKIVLCVNKLYNFYNKYLYKRKQALYFEFYNNLLKLLYSKNNIIKNNNKNIHDRLFKCSLMKQIYLRELEQKLNQNEEKMCTFSPKTNKGKIKCRFLQKNKNNQLLEINLNNPRFSHSFKADNINKNINLNNKIDKNNHILFSKEKHTKANQAFYKNNNAPSGEYIKNNEKFKKKNNLYNIENKLDINYINNDKNKVSYITKNNLINNDFLFEENNFNKTSRNINHFKKQKTNNNDISVAYLNYYNNNLNHKKMNENKMNNLFISKSNNCILIDNENKKIKEKKFFRKTTNERIIKENTNNGDLKTIELRNRNEFNIIKDKTNKSLNDLYNIRNNNFNYQNKKRNSFQNISLKSFKGIAPFISTNKIRDNCQRVIYEPTKCYDNNSKDKDENKAQLSNDISSSIINNINKNNIDSSNIYNENSRNSTNKKINSICSNNNKDLIKEYNFNNYFDTTKANTIDKKEYFYTFRKWKIPYNSFNYLSTKKHKCEMENKKNESPISLINKQNKGKYISIQYNSNLNRTNSIYLNNYNKTICRIKKDRLFKSSNNSFRRTNLNKKSSFFDLSFKDSKTKISNTNFCTNNDTKGWSVSSFSLYPNKSSKENQSIKNNSLGEYNNSINNIKSGIKYNNLNKQNIANNRKIKSKNKQKIRKTINSINSIDKTDNIIEKEKNCLNCYIDDSNKKERKNSNNLEIDSNVVNECYINLNNGIQRSEKNNYNNSSGKDEKYLTLQSISDSKMLELAEHYINNDEDSLEQMDIKLIELRKNFKKEKACKDITFG